MTQNTKFDESDWQTLYCVEARFPGFTRDVWDYYWRHKESSREFPASLEDRARGLKDKFDIDLAVTDGNEREAASNIKEWVSGVDEYYDHLGKLTAEELYVEFKKTLGFHMPAPQKRSHNSDIDAGPSPEIMLRYAYWDIDDVVIFFSNFVDGPDLDSLTEFIRDSIKDGKIDPEDLPSKFVILARSADLANVPSINDISDIYPESLEYYTSNRVKNIMTVIAAMAKSKFGYLAEKNNTASTDIATIIQNDGIDITSETVRKILQRASGYYRSDFL